jgi:hypothetical protein
LAYFTSNAPIAQLVEHLICNQRVRGSSPCGGTIKSMSYGFSGASVLPLGYKWVTKSENDAVSSRKKRNQ